MQFQNFLAPIATKWTENVEPTFWHFNVLEDKDFFCPHTGHIPGLYIILPTADQIWKPFIWGIFFSLVLHEFFPIKYIVFYCWLYFFKKNSSQTQNMSVPKLHVLPMLFWYVIYFKDVIFINSLRMSYMHTVYYNTSYSSLWLFTDPYPLSLNFMSFLLIAHWDQSPKYGWFTRGQTPKENWLTLK